MTQQIVVPERRWLWEEHAEVIKRTSWGAIFVGVVHVLAIMLMLGLLGLAIGLATIQPATEADPMWGLGVGAMIWWIVTGIVAIFVGSYVAASLAGIPRRMTGVWHGLTVWGFSTLLMLFFAGNVFAWTISGAFSAITSAINRTNGAAVTVNANGGAAGTQSQQSGQTGAPLAEARRELREMASSVKAEEISGDVASAAAKAAAWSFVLLLVGAATGAIGGALGAPHEVLETITRIPTTHIPPERRTEPPPQV